MSELVLLPAQLHAVAATPGFDLRDKSSVRLIMSGGDIVTSSLIQESKRLFPGAGFMTAWGMSEAGGCFAWPYWDDIESIPFYSGISPLGRVTPGSRIRLVSEDGKVVQRGEFGELHIQSDSVFKSYLAAPEKMDVVYTDEEGRWFKTGDLGMINDAGDVYIVGRLKDVIKRAAISIAPAAIESCLAAFTGSQTAVVGRPHPTLGQEPFAILQSFNGKSESDLSAHVIAMYGPDWVLGDTEAGSFGSTRRVVSIRLMMLRLRVCTVSQYDDTPYTRHFPSSQASFHHRRLRPCPRELNQTRCSYDTWWYNPKIHSTFMSPFLSFPILSRSSASATTDFESRKSFVDASKSTMNQIHWVWLEETTSNETIIAAESLPGSLNQGPQIWEAACPNDRLEVHSSTCFALLLYRIIKIVQIHPDDECVLNIQSGLDDLRSKHVSLCDGDGSPQSIGSALQLRQVRKDARGGLDLNCFGAILLPRQRSQVKPGLVVKGSDTAYFDSASCNIVERLKRLPTSSATATTSPAASEPRTAGYSFSQ
ncbi:acetyl-CoA synthetase-like protein, partial [Aureobasidium melanogenum]